MSWLTALFGGIQGFAAPAPYEPLPLDLWRSSMQIRYNGTIPGYLPLSSGVPVAPASCSYCGRGRSAAATCAGCGAPR